MTTVTLKLGGRNQKKKTAEISSCLQYVIILTLILYCVDENNSKYQNNFSNTKKTICELI